MKVNTRVDKFTNEEDNRSYKVKKTGNFNSLFLQHFKSVLDHKISQPNSQK